MNDAEAIELHLALARSDKFSLRQPQQVTTECKHAPGLKRVISREKVDSIHTTTLELLSSARANQAFDTELTDVWPRAGLEKRACTNDELIHRDPFHCVFNRYCTGCLQSEIYHEVLSICHLQSGNLRLF